MPPLCPTDALTQFVEHQLVKQGFCTTSNSRSDAAARVSTLSQSTAQSQKPLRVPESPIESAWKALKQSLTSAKKETLIYNPLSRFLTLLAEKFLFIPWDCRTIGEEGELYRQDILVVNAQSEEIDRFLRGGLDLAWLPDRFRSPGEKGKARSKIYYSDIQMVCEVKACDAPEKSFTLFKHAVQVLKYQFTISRYQPQHAFYIGILAYWDGFYIVDYYPDRAFFSSGKIRTLHGWLCEWPSLTCRSALSQRNNSHHSSLQIVTVKRNYSLVFQGTLLIQMRKLIGCLTFIEGTVGTATLMSASQFALWIRI